MILSISKHTCYPFPFLFVPFSDHLLILNWIICSCKLNYISSLYSLSASPLYFGCDPKNTGNKSKKNRQMELCSLKAKGIINRVKTRQDGYSVWSF